MHKPFIQISANYFDHFPIVGAHVTVVVQKRAFTVGEHMTININNPEPIVSMSGELVFVCGRTMEFRIIQILPYIPLGIQGNFLKLTLLAL
jgi:hypothetical protein